MRATRRGLLERGKRVKKSCVSWGRVNKTSVVTDVSVSRNTSFERNYAKAAASKTAVPAKNRFPPQGYYPKPRKNYDSPFTGHTVRPPTTHKYKMLVEVEKARMVERQKRARTEEESEIVHEYLKDRFWHNRMYLSSQIWRRKIFLKKSPLWTRRLNQYNPPSLINVPTFEQRFKIPERPADMPFWYKSKWPELKESDYPLHVYSDRIPAPRNGETVESFLKKIGKECDEHVSKFPTWESLFKMRRLQMKKAGISNCIQRRWILKWTSKYRQGVDPGSQENIHWSHRRNLYGLRLGRGK